MLRWPRHLLYEARFGKEEAEVLVALDAQARQKRIQENEARDPALTGPYPALGEIRELRSELEQMRKHAVEIITLKNRLLMNQSSIERSLAELQIAEPEQRRQVAEMQKRKEELRRRFEMTAEHLAKAQQEVDRMKKKVRTREGEIREQIKELKGELDAQLDQLGQRDIAAALDRLRMARVDAIRLLRLDVADRLCEEIALLEAKRSKVVNVAD
jgi:hypothetical protein